MKISLKQMLKNWQKCTQKIVTSLLQKLWKKWHHIDNNNSAENFENTHTTIWSLKGVQIIAQSGQISSYKVGLLLQLEPNVILM